MGNTYQLKTFCERHALQNHHPSDRMPMEEVGQSPVKKWMIAIGTLVVLAAVVTIILLRRRHRRRMKEVELDE